MNLPTSALGDLALLGLIACSALGITLTVAALATRRGRLAGVAALGTLVLWGGYAATLAGVALASREHTLALGEEKSVEGFDPHLHFSVAGPATRAPDGAVLLGVRLRSDALRAVQDPRSLRAALFDGRGRRYTPEWSSASAPGTAGAFPPFGRTLAPGTAYEATLRFRPGPQATGLRLLIDELPQGPGMITIGSESSPLHRKTYFALTGN